MKRYVTGRYGRIPDRAAMKAFEHRDKYNKSYKGDNLHLMFKWEATEKIENEPDGMWYNIFNGNDLGMKVFDMTYPENSKEFSIDNYSII